MFLPAATNYFRLLSFGGLLKRIPNYVYHILAGRKDNRKILIGMTERRGGPIIHYYTDNSFGTLITDRLIGGR